MREIYAQLNGEPITLGATFKASIEISERIADPLMIAREAALEAMMGDRGVTYTPRWMFTVETVPLLIWIGIKHGGGKHTLEQVQEMVFDAGFIPARAVATDYLAAIVTPQSDEVTASEGNQSGE